jgi:hypothetical protein
MNEFAFIVFVLTFAVLWLSAETGIYLRRRHDLRQDEREDLSVILTATLTLLGLVVGFSFSMAVTRYDQRKNNEENEANAIGTEYLRAGLLPPADASAVRKSLTDYLNQRISFYTTFDERRIEQINASTARLQRDLWSTVRGAAAAQPTPVVALTVSGLNDVLNSEGYTQASWWNRIPIAAWALMGAIAICSNVLFGYLAHGEKKSKLLFVLPLIVAISFFFIADLDSPRTGVIRVHPHNLMSVSRRVASAIARLCKPSNGQPHRLGGATSNPGEG